MTEAFIHLLQATADVLARFSEPEPANGRKWDGTAYVASVGSTFDPYAAKWWSALTTLAGVLASQEVALSGRQKEYLDRFLFGGMGSFNDFVLDEGRLGDQARQANHELNRLRTNLFEEFRRAATIP